MNDQSIPQSGYRLECLYFSRLQFEGVADTAEIKAGADTPIWLAWDWRIIAERRFEVLLNVKTEPCAARPERIDVLAIARFELQGNTPPELPTAAFAKVGAISILVPYAREAIASLSGRGIIGAFYLDPMNVAAMDFDGSVTTAAQQFRDNPSLTGTFGAASASPTSDVEGAAP